jgi:predicted glycoside hydrolase/deacetylase ChbG (UPF0249 family)
VTATRLIVSADDFGLTAGVDRGIRAAVAAGAVTSVGVMANLVDPSSLAALVTMRAGLSVGVHLNLTTGSPLSPPAEVPSLVDAGGRFLPLATLARRAFAGRLRRAEITLELGAQVDRLGWMGVAADHLDSHEHVHLLPGVLAAVISVARRAGIACMRSHRPCLLGATRYGRLAYYAHHPRRIVTHTAKHLLALRLHLAGIATPDGMVTPSLLARAVAGGPLAEWEAVVGALPAGTWELVVHPADLTVAPRAGEEERLGDLVERRAAELAALRAPRFRAMLAARGVEPVSFAPVRLPPPPTWHAQEGHAARRA